LEFLQIDYEGTGMKETGGFQYGQLYMGMIC